MIHSQSTLNDKTTKQHDNTMKTLNCKTTLITLFALFTMGVGLTHAAPTGVGTFTTSSKVGTIKFTAVKAVRGIGYQGNVNISGKNFPGVMYAGNPTGTGLVWYYPTSYEEAGNAMLYRQTDGSFSGAINFISKKGPTTDSGTAKMTFK